MLTKTKTTTTTAATSNDDDDAYNAIDDYIDATATAVAHARDRVVEGATYAKDKAIDAKDSIAANLPSVEQVKQTAVDAKDTVVEKVIAAKDVVAEKAVAAKDVVAEKATQGIIVFWRTHVFQISNNLNIIGTTKSCRS